MVGHAEQIHLLRRDLAFCAAEHPRAGTTKLAPDVVQNDIATYIDPERHAHVSEVASLEDCISKTYFPYEVLEVGRKDFRSDFTSCSVGQLLVTNSYADTTLRGRIRQPRGSHDNGVYVVHLEEGEGAISFRGDGPEVSVHKNEIILINSMIPLQTAQLGPNSHGLVITIPTRLFESHLTNADQWCPVVRSSECGAGALLRNQLLTLWRERDNICSIEADDIKSALIYLIGATFRDRKRVADFSSRNVHKHYQRVVDLIFKNLDDPELSADFVTARLGISKSYLFAIMRAGGVTLGKLIIDARLERASGVLASPSGRNQTISELAYSLGFQELSHFSRRFSARYGVSPRAFRERAIGLAC